MDSIKRKHLCGQIIAPLFICAMFLLAETTAGLLISPKNRLERILAVLEQDADLFWKQKSNLDTVFEGVRVKTNSLGLRNGPVQYEKKKDTFRIICLGASPTFGWGVKEGQKYSGQLEQLLRKEFKESKSVEVINAGVIGYSSYQGLKFLKNKMIKFSPDLVVVPYVLNDVDKHRFYRSNGKSDKELSSKSKILVGVENFLNRSMLVGALRKMVVKYQSLAMQYFGSGGESEYIEIRRVALEDYRENLKEIVDVARKNGSEVIFLKMPVNLPASEYVSDQTLFQTENYIEKALMQAVDYNYEGAIVSLNRAVDLNPYSGKAFYYLGKYYARIKSFDEARESFQKAVKMELFECGKLGKKYNRAMQEVADKEKVILVDIVSEFDEFRKSSTADLFLDVRNDTIHPSSTGHAIISRAIYKTIMDNSFIN